MASFNSGDINPLRFDKVQPVDSHGEKEREKNKRKVLYRGRAWSEEEEEDIPRPTAQEKKEEQGSQFAIYANRLLVEKAKK